MSANSLTIRLLLPLCTFLATALAAPSAWAFKYCVKARMDITNELPAPAADWPGVGVNHWEMDGVRMKVEKKNQGFSSWSDQTGWQWADGDGCLTLSGTSGDYRAKVQTRGRPMNSWEVTVTDTNDPNDIWYFTDATNGHYLTQPQPTDTFISEISYSSDLMAIYTVIANVAHDRFNGGLDGMSVHVMKVDPLDTPICGSDPNASKTCSNGTEVQIKGTKSHSKLLIAHEWGHVVHHRAITEGGGGEWWSNDYTYFSPIPDCQLGDDGSNDKGTRSQEYTSAAMTEGFAEFVSFDSWNVHFAGDSNPNAYYFVEGLGVPTTGDVLVSMDFGEPYFENKYCDYYCYCGSGAGHGVLLDWQRLLWDYHTNNNIGDYKARRTHADMLSIAKIGWGQKDAFEMISANLAGDDAIRWGLAAGDNGVR